MSEHVVTQPDAGLGRIAVRALFLSFILVAIQTFALLGGAGWPDWSRGWREWLLVGLLELMALAWIGVQARYNPRLLRERFRQHANTRTFDIVITRLYLAVILILLHIAGRDAVGAGWCPLSTATIGPGVVLFLLGNALILWTMVENRHLETTVRIQEDHKVVTTGPYRLVRHPMYVGSITMTAGWPLVVGSAWAYVPFAVIVILFIIRTSLEDQTLQNELPGYQDYARQTRYRLVPGIW